MSWIESLAGFTKRLIIIDIRITANEEKIASNSNAINSLRQLDAQMATNEKRIGANAEEINSLRQDLRSLTDFVRRVSYAVKRNEERSEDKYNNLVLTLKLELAQLDKKLDISNLESQHLASKSEGQRPATEQENSLNGFVPHQQLSPGILKNPENL